MVMIRPRRTSGSPPVCWRSHGVNAFAGVQWSSEMLLFVAQLAHDVFHHHHRPIDDQPEVHRPQAHQVARDPELHHAREREQNESGIAAARSTRPASCPASPASTTTTRIAPSNRFFFTVATVRSTRSARSYCVRISMPGGSREAISSQAFAKGLGHHPAVLSRQHHRGPQHGFLPVLRRRAGPEARADRHVRHVPTSSGFTPART
jgi:hypothetical protein